MKLISENHQLNIRTLGLVFLDVFLVIASSLIGLELRFDFVVDQYYFQELAKAIIPMVLIYLICFGCVGLYRSLWRYASGTESIYIGAGVAAATVLTFGVTRAFHIILPRGALLIQAVMMFLFVTVTRLSYRVVRRERYRFFLQEKPSRVMIVGAGQAGNLLINELALTDKLEKPKKVVCAIDDDEKKHGCRIGNVPVVGGRESIPQMAEKYHVNEIYITMPSVGAETISKIVEICQETTCSIKKIPGIYQMVEGSVLSSQLVDLDVNDLLGRDPIQVNMDEIMGYVQGKTILVTGAGGSIGSELCRQIALKHPKKLIMVDIYENSIFAVQLELKEKFPDLDMAVLIGSVRDTQRMENIFTTYHPQIIYHAAAHKHVPLMEDSPNESIKNNVFGTYRTAMMADHFGAERFVLISTDKAVNPTNIMGASKRICEMIVQSLAKESKTRFVAVRFGNVLGSNGSVIPIFKKQIAEGGPVTVTHREITRFFMTIPEAVSLVLQAGAYAEGGEIFVLDMGEPVKIYDLAEKMIRLSGHVPNQDIPIEIVGLRPGEKLYEEILMKEEGMKTTANHKIHIGRPIEMDCNVFWQKLSDLKNLCERNDINIREAVRDIVPTYHFTE